MQHFTSPLSPLTAYWTGSLEMMGGPAGTEHVNAFNKDIKESKNCKNQNTTIQIFLNFDGFSLFFF